MMGLRFLISLKCAEKKRRKEGNIQRTIMKGKTILGILVAAILFVVLDQVMTTQKENANKRFQEALEEYDKSSSVQYNSVVQQQKMVDAQELKEKHEQSLFPTKGEIDSVNTRLPILVSEGTLNTKIEYNENTKVQTFYYRFTKEVCSRRGTSSVASIVEQEPSRDSCQDLQYVARISANW